MTIKLRAILSLGGRPKEEGGHKPYKLTFDKSTSEEFERLRSRGVKISKFIEGELKQSKHNLDFMSRFQLALEKSCELAEKGELEGFSITEYMEDLKKEQERRHIAFIEYTKKHLLKSEQVHDILEYNKRFEEWYEKEKKG